MAVMSVNLCSVQKPGMFLEQQKVHRVCSHIILFHKQSFCFGEWHIPIAHADILQVWKIKKADLFFFILCYAFHIKKMKIKDP